jgi:hypothetical protein
MPSAAEKFTFTCPSCAKVLRSSTRPPAEKKVKCHGFIADVEDEEERTAIQDKTKSRPTPKDDDADPDKAPRRKKSRAQDDDDDDDRPRKKKSRDEDDDDAGPPRNRRRRDDDDEDDDDAMPTKKKKAKKQAGSSMLLVILFLVLGGGMMLSCAMCGVGAFVWPGFLRSKNADLAAFVPPDANVVMGMNPKMLKTKFGHLEKMFPQKNAIQPGRRQWAWDDIDFNSERMLIFGNATNFEQGIVSAFQSTSSDIAKVKRNPNIGPAQTLGGHANIHKATDAGLRDGLLPWVAFTSDNVVLVAKRQEDLIASLNHAKNKGKKNATWEMGQPHEKSMFWLAFTPDVNMMGKMRGQMQFGGPAPFQNVMPALGDIKGITFTMDVDGKDDIALTGSLVCKNADDAAKIRVAAEGAWTIGKVQMQNALQNPFFRMPNSLMADLNSMTFAANGVNMTASMKIQSQTITELANLQNNFAAPIFQPPPVINPPPIQPPPFNPPPFNPPPKFNPKPVGGVPPTALVLVGGQASFNGNLAATDNTFNGKLHKQFNITFVQGKTYQIDNRNNGGAFGFDPYLILIGPDGTVLAQNDDFGGTLDSRIVHRADRTGTYQILATSLSGRDTANFALTVRQLGN